ncbi:prevent-host-death family protein [Thioploca ingrica]|uniref:Antitoxin n=1 Tax=Thioploca ingrica TaxID=40754 RepID=A0A090AJG4_9GAMM|nr:prevent-host-death family protein [Thioploca ingrica]
MQMVSFDEAKQNLATICEQTCQDHEPYLVKGENNNQSVVILSLEDYNAWIETHYLLSNPANAKWLLTGDRLTERQ